MPIGFKDKERKKTISREETVPVVEEHEVAESQSAAHDVIEFAEPSLDPGEDAFTQEELQLFAAEIPELDVKAGLLYCAESKFFYVEMLNEFADGKKDEELSGFLEKQDWDNYRIVVHALKSNAKTIGAMELSEEARLQEMAAKELRTEDVSADHGALAEHYKKLQNQIRKVLGEI